MKRVNISLETAEKLAEMLPPILELNNTEKRAFYKLCSSIDRTMSTSPFRPSLGVVAAGKIKCIKAWRGALNIIEGEVPNLVDSKYAIEQGKWIETEDIKLFKMAVEIFNEAGISLEYK